MRNFSKSSVTNHFSITIPMKTAGQAQTWIARISPASRNGSPYKATMMNGAAKLTGNAITNDNHRTYRRLSFTRRSYWAGSEDFSSTRRGKIAAATAAGMKYQTSESLAETA